MDLTEDCNISTRPCGNHYYRTNDPRVCLSERKFSENVLHFRAKAQR